MAKMIWQVKSAEENSREYDRLLEKGWNPFAVSQKQYDGSNHNIIWFKSEIIIEAKKK